MNPAMHILIVDDHSLFRTGLRMLLKQRFKTPAILEASSTQEAIQCNAPELDLILLDIQLQGLNGLDSIALLRGQWPQTPVVVVSSSLDPQDAADALACGAVAFLSKAETDKKIVEIVARVMKLDASPAFSNSASTSDRFNQAALTPRQHEVLGLLCEGLSNKAIAKRLNLSEFTVRSHVQAVFNFLRVTSRSQAIVAARRLGLFE